MERYREYKDSGVQWLGEIPSHWKAVRLGRIASLKTGTTPSFYELEINGGYVNWYTPSDFGENFELGESLRKLNKNSFDEAGYAYVPANSVLLIGIGGTAGKTSLAPMPCYTNQQITSILPKSVMRSKYLLLYLRSQRFVLLNTAHYTTLPILNNTFLSQIVLPLPPQKEQDSIATYLDTKCSRIETLLSNKEKEISLLQEMKQRIIADAVTRGLNPNVKFKSTNIPWLPEIPEHWNEIKLKALTIEGKLKNKNGEVTNVLSLSYGKIIKKKNINEGLVPADYATYQIVEPNDIILRLTDLQNDHRSLRCGLVQQCGIITSAYTCLKMKQGIAEYFYLLLHSYDIKKVFYSMGGGLRQSMNYTEVTKLYVPVPPLSEQHAIVSYITERTAKIDSLIEKLNKEIECIKEYKQRLISDVVTGQIKVF